MRTLILLLVALVAAAVATRDLWGTPQEREVLINEAISEAKLSAQLKSEAAKVKSSSQTSKQQSPYKRGGFKKPSEKARRHGNARILLEDMIKRAERKIEENKRAGIVSASSRKKAEVLAEELFHTPGTLLSQDEFARMYSESGCEELNSFSGKCRRIPYIFSFRTIDGTCNNLRKPIQGASGTAFRRLAPAVYEDGRGSLRGTFQFLNIEEDSEDLPQILRIGPFVPPSPSARLISKAIVTNSSENEIPFTHILMQWGQFLDHDLDLGPELEEECEECILTDICQPIRVTADDRTFGLGTPQNGSCLAFRRAISVCNEDTPGSFSPREQINDVTSYIDGSMVYGSNSLIGTAVRESDSPLLRTGPDVPSVDGKPSLPIDDEEIVPCLGRELIRDCFLCGDIRCNEQLSLSVMHTIWVRLHNVIATELRYINRQWSNERTFQEARKIVGALVQKITYIDYLPKVMGPAVFAMTIGSYEGYDRSVDASVPNAFATAAYRYGHSLIRPQFNRLGPGYVPLSIGPLSLANMFFNPPQFEASGGSDPFVRGWVTQNSRRMDEFLNLVLTSQLFSSNGGIGMDLASLNIQRQRDHGMPSYGTWRTFCQGVFPELSEEMPDLENPYTFLRFLQLYGRVEDADLWVAGIAERRLPDSLLGPTFACLFGLTFRNVRDGDRFYYERDGVFTPNQLAVIRQLTLSRVLCETTHINSIQPDAFLSNQTRVPCSSLPPLDLEPWREEICYAHITTGGSLSTTLRIFMAVRDNTGFGPVELFTNDDNALCLPFKCPSSYSSVRLYAYPLIEDLSDCTVTSVLPSVPVPNEPAAVFINTISNADITPANGLFRDLSSCMATSSVNAFTWSCPSVPASTQADNDCDPYDQECHTMSPDGLDMLTEGMDRDDIQMQSSKSPKKSDDTVAKPSSVSNQDLLAELQEVMKNLN